MRNGKKTKIGATRPIKALLPLINKIFGDFLKILKRKEHHYRRLKLE